MKKAEERVNRKSFRIKLFIWIGMMALFFSCFCGCYGKNTRTTADMAKMGEEIFLHIPNIVYCPIHNPAGGLPPLPPPPESYLHLCHNVLKVPHHGRKGENSEEFLKAVSPEIAVITCSEDKPADDGILRMLDLKRSPNTAFTIRTGISSKAVSSYAGIYLLDIPAHWAFYRRYWSDIPALVASETIPL